MAPIVDSSALEGIHGLGPRILTKVQEIINTGSLQMLKNFKSDSKYSALLAFSKIWGVGPTKARDLFRAGFRTIAEIKERGVEELNAQQRIGLEHYDDFNERMPCKEASEIEK